MCVCVCVCFREMCVLVGGVCVFAETVCVCVRVLRVVCVLGVVWFGEGGEGREGRRLCGVFHGRRGVVFWLCVCLV